MNRKIKFRAWQKYHKQMLDVTNIDFRDGEIYSLTVEYLEGTIPRFVTYGKDYDKLWLDYDCINLMQYTGLKDKNGKEIYEGDIVRITLANGNNEKDYKVFYFEEGASFQLKNIRCYYDVDTFWRYSNKQIEVIGNIYKNPELLDD